MQICFFTDNKALNFNPLTLTRPLDDLRIGIFSLRRKWEYRLKVNNTCRTVLPYLEGEFPKGTLNKTDDCLWINSRCLPDQQLIHHIQKLQTGQALTHNKDIVAAKVDGDTSSRLFNNNQFDPGVVDQTSVVESRLIENVWDLLTYNADEIERDLTLTNLSALKPSRHPSLVTSASENIYAAEDVTIEPGCIFLANEGPVILQQGVTIQAGSILRGPVSVGENSTVKMGARIYGGTTLGPFCKAGGEVANCIFHSYSNKGHEGYTGDSVFGQWVNIGAGTNISNLKNNYNTVKLPHWDSKQEVESGQQFLGTIMADHSKTAINTKLNTGTMCGVSANIFMSGFPPKLIPSFSWVGSSDMQTYHFEKALETMAAMMVRRNKELDSDYQHMMRHLFKNR
ncbi:MAG: glucose-1-phosphate thymidylyltransferase [Balneolaceae bacterium]|nr:glucose-1-phosphate thymidylyltransferase [Balneolaceae bacterium]